MTTTSTTREVIGGVDTHGKTHHAAAVDAATGKLLGDREFPATPRGYRQLLSWLRCFGTVAKIGMEGTGSYGAGLLRCLGTEGVAVIEVARPKPPGPTLAGQV
jgi:transposase